MACKTVTNPSRTRRTVVAVGLERRIDNGDGTVTVCERVGGLQQLILYDTFNPVSMDADIIALNRAKNGLGPDAVAVGIATYNIAGAFYMVGSGIVNVPPSWAILLRAAGFGQHRYVPDSGAPDLTGTDVLAPTQGDGSYVQANQVGLTEGKKYSYKFSIWTAAGKQESQLSDAVEVTLTSTNDKLTFDFTDSLAASAWAEDAVGIGIYRTTGFTGTHNSTTNPWYLHGHYLVNDIVDGVHSLAGTAYLFSDYLHDSDLADPAPAESAAADYVAWSPNNEDHDSLTVKGYLDGNSYRATGVRGTFSFAGDPAQPVKADFNLMGVYNDPTMDDPNPTLLANPGIPPRLENIFLSIVGDGNAMAGLQVKNLGIDIGAQPAQRLDANQPSGLTEYGIFDEFAPRLTVTVETDTVNNWTKWFRDNELFRIEFFISPDRTYSGATAADKRANFLAATDHKGERLQFVAGCGEDLQSTTLGTSNNRTPWTVGLEESVDRAAQLIEAPTFDDSNGVRTVSLTFSLNGRDIRDADAVDRDNFLLIRQF